MENVFLQRRGAARWFYRWQHGGPTTLATDGSPRAAAPFNAPCWQSRRDQRRGMTSMAAPADEPAAITDRATDRQRRSNWPSGGGRPRGIPDWPLTPIHQHPITPNPSPTNGSPASNDPHSPPPTDHHRRP